MNKILVLAAVAALLFVAVILGTAFGAMAGWAVGLVFPETMQLVASTLNLQGAPPWQIGAILGFVGGFFRPAVTKT